MAEDKPVQPMHEYLKEGADLANTYAKDGAYHTAADIYAEVAKEARKHSDWIKREERKLDITKGA